MYKFTRSALNYPPFSLTLGVIVGGLAVHNDSFLKEGTDWFYALWLPEVGPAIVGFVIAALELLIFVIVVSDLATWTEGSLTAYFARRRDQERAERELNEQVSAANRKREEEAHAFWITERLAPWKSFLDDIGESVLFYEIEQRIRDLRVFDDRAFEARHQDVLMTAWLVEKAVAFERNGTTDLNATQAKIHRFLDHAFSLAGQNNAWHVMQTVPDAVPVLVKFFIDQVDDLTYTWGGSNDKSGEFMRFTVWAVSNSRGPSLVIT